MIADKYAEEIEGILGRFPHKKSAVLPLMHLAQKEYGYMSEDAMREVAGILDLDPTHVLSLAGFYSLFHEDFSHWANGYFCNDFNWVCNFTTAYAVTTACINRGNN